MPDKRAKYPPSSLPAHLLKPKQVMQRVEQPLLKSKLGTSPSAHPSQQIGFQEKSLEGCIDVMPEHWM